MRGAGWKQSGRFGWTTRPLTHEQGLFLPRSHALFFLVGFNNIESADTPAHQTWWNKYIGRRWTNSSKKVTIYTTKHGDFSSNGKTEIFSFFPYAFAWINHQLHSFVAPPMWADWWGRGQWDRRKCWTKLSVGLSTAVQGNGGRGWVGYQYIK